MTENPRITGNLCAALMSGAVLPASQLKEIIDTIGGGWELFSEEIGISHEEMRFFLNGDVPIPLTVGLAICQLLYVCRAALEDHHNLPLSRKRSAWRVQEC